MKRKRTRVREPEYCRCRDRIICPVCGVCERCGKPVERLPKKVKRNG